MQYAVRRTSHFGVVLVNSSSRVLFEKLIVAELVKIFLILGRYEVSLLCSQEPTRHRTPFLASPSSPVYTLKIHLTDTL